MSLHRIIAIQVAKFEQQSKEKKELNQLTECMSLFRTTHCFILLTAHCLYHNVLKFSNICAWAKSVDPDQTACL